jgi:hypothetical protein
MREGAGEGVDEAAVGGDDFTGVAGALQLSVVQRTGVSRPIRRWNVNELEPTAVEILAEIAMKVPGTAIAIIPEYGSTCRVGRDLCTTLDAGPKTHWRRTPGVNAVEHMMRKATRCATAHQRSKIADNIEPVSPSRSGSRAHRRGSSRWR